MVTTRIKGSQIFDGTIKSEDIDDTLEKEFTKVRVTTGDSAPDFLHLKIATSGSIIANVIGISGSAQLLALSGTAAGSNTQVQFNDGGSFAGSSGLTYSNTSATLFGVTGSFSDNFSIGGNLGITKNISLTGSNIFLANPLSIDNNTLYIDSVNNRIGVGKIPNVTFDVSGTLSPSGADVPSAIFNGDTFISGAFGVSDYIQVKPVGTLRIPTNTSASYIYTSGSTNDLYFTQYAGSYTNTTRLRWLESALATGLLHGGIISATPGGTTFNISAGEGIIVTQNAFTASAPYPTIQYVTWPDQNNIPLLYSGSARITYVGIDNTGAPIQQTLPWGTLNITEWDDSIQLGAVLHLSGNVVNGTFNSPSVSYAPQQRQDDFFRAFGPLKISGHTLAASSSAGVGTLGITKSSGTAYKEGANYTIDPNHPSTVVESTGITVSKIYRYYLSGSTPVIDTGIANAGYTTIDPTKYVNTTTGLLTTVPNKQWSIQRVFWIPNSPTNAFIVYYGNGHYPDSVAAENAVTSESFVEAPNTAQNAIQVASIIVREDCTDLTSSTTAVIQQAGLFRQVGGIGSSGQTSIPTKISQLSDVSISGITDKDLLVYNSTTGYWNNSKIIGTLSASVITSNFSGSLTKLSDGTSYLVAGSGISITTGSGGSITITNDGTVGDITSVTAGTGLTGGGTSGDVTLAINDSVVATVSGTSFTGDISAPNIYSSGIITASLGFSGSLTTLTDGTSYLVAGQGIDITSASNGAVTVSTTAASTVAGSNTQIQFNDSGSFGASSNLLFDKSNNALTLSGSLFINTSSYNPYDYVIAAYQTVDGNKTVDSGYSGLQKNQLLVTGSSISTSRLVINSEYRSNVTAGTAAQSYSGVIGFRAYGTHESEASTTSQGVAGLEAFAAIEKPETSSIAGNVNIQKGIGLQLGWGNSRGLNYSGSITTVRGIQMTYLNPSSARTTSTLVGVRIGLTGGVFGGAGVTDVYGIDMRPLSGSGIKLGVRTYDPIVIGADNINSSEKLRVSGSAYFDGAATFISGLSGSLTKLTDGSSYLIAGSGISITSASNGAITITNDGTVGDITSVTAGTGLTGGGTSGAVTLAINDSIVATVSGTSFTGDVNVNSDNLNTLSGSTFNLLQSASVLNIGTTSGVVRTVNIGSNSHAGNIINIDAGNTINIGNNASPSGTRTINIGTGNQPTFLTIGQNNNNSVTTIYGGSNGITLATANSGPVSIAASSAAGNISIGTGTATQTINIASGSGVKTTYLGSPHTSSTTYLYAGTGGIFVSGSTVTFQQGLTSVGDILPSADVTYSLGSATQRWQHIYTGDLHLKNERGDWTIIEEETYLTIRNNKTGKRYKINMEPLPELNEELGKFSTGPTQQK